MHWQAPTKRGNSWAYVFISYFSLHSLTKGRSTDGFFLNVEELIRQAIKEFDYHECTIFKQLVQTIAPVEKVSVVNNVLSCRQTL